jgi:hypothetical protein
MFAFSMYCCLCGCSIKNVLTNNDNRDYSWMKNLVYLKSDNIENEIYNYDSYGKIYKINEDDKEITKINIMDLHWKDKLPNCISCYDTKEDISFVAVHKSCWLTCGKPKFNDITKAIYVQEFYVSDAISNNFNCKKFLKEFSEKSWMLDDPLHNKKNADRIRSHFMKNKLKKHEAVVNQ